MHQTQSSYKHAEAFCLMKYSSIDGTESEWIWNSRDGVTPFIILNRTKTKELRHHDQSQDRCIPDYQPLPGQRVFIDITEERSRVLAAEMVEKYWEHPNGQMQRCFGGSKEAAIAQMQNNFKAGIDADLVEWGINGHSGES